MEDKELNLEPVSMYALFAKMFAHIAREVENSCGEKGIQAVREGVRQFGLERGRNIAERAKSLGLDNNAENYLSSYDMGRSELFESKSTIKVKSIEQHFTKCIFAQQWILDNNQQYGIHYCEIIDAAIAEGYNKNFKCTHNKHFFKDNCCHFLFEMQDEEK